MKSNWYITIWILGVLVVVIALFVYKVSGSEDAVYVEGCVPYNVQIKKGEVEENTSVISWKSKEKCSGYILYGKEMRGLDMVSIDLENETESKDHSVTLRGLLSSKRYYFSIVSNGISFGKDGLPLQFSIDSL